VRELALVSAGAVALRAPVARDLDAVVALDRARGGRTRHGFFVKRWRAIETHPDAFVSIVAESPGGVAGYVLAHIIRGEFGADAPAAVLDAIAVAPTHAERGLGRDLISALVEAARHRGAREIRTQARWDESGLVQFFARSGFALAPRVVLERDTAAPGW